MNSANQELDMAYNYAMYTHRNIFLTGKAGTGKTTFLRQLYAQTRKRTIIVAPTGVAAINAGGVTIHSFFQLAPGLFLPGGQMIAAAESKMRFTFSKHKINILRALDLLVIDEVSMVRADLMDAIDDVLRRYKHRDRPFGGVQLLLIGDLQQLAPVATDEEWQVLQQYYQTPYFFSSQSLLQTDIVCIELQHVYRQQDHNFVALLNAVREGRADASVLATLNNRYMPSFRPPDGEQWITLTTHNYQAAQINAQHMAALTTTPRTFKAKITGEFPETSYPTDAELTLKVGAQVMFCKNDTSTDKAFYNGRIGRIDDISGEGVAVVCPRNDDSSRTDRILVRPMEWTNTRYTTDSTTGTISEEKIGSFTQIPLRTAWAITIHKSQGLTFDHAIVNAGRAFSHGQVYVALSRCRTLQGLVLATPIPASVITTDPNVTQFQDFADDHRPTAESFIHDRRAYVEDILNDIFDFQQMSMHARYYARLTAEHLGHLYPTYATATAAAATAVDTQLAAVGLRFQQQIHQLVPLAETFSANTLLRERVQKAMLYYSTTTPTAIGEMVEAEMPEVDNKQTREQLTRQLQLLQADYTEKMSIFTACLQGFTLDAYWNAKAQTAMTEDTKPARRTRTSKASKAAKPAHSLIRQEGQGAAPRPSGGGLEGASVPHTAPTKKSTSKSKVDIDYSHIRNGRLYKAILTWRSDVAAERKLPPAYVMPMKAVIGIANLEPTMQEELLAIPGIGPKTVAEHGPDLLELVATHRLRHS